MDFTEFGLDERLLKGIEAAGYVTCTPVQEQVIKASKAAEGTKGPDLYVQSQTGTGKTCAYLVAVIGEMVKAENAGKKCLILAPTRELAVQIEEEAKVLVGTSGLKAFSVYGGVGYEKQIATLKKGVDIVIGTPGRVIDLNEGGNLDLSNSHFCVIDEADRMFDMGFYDDLRKILKKLPEAETRQTMLFSATLNTYVKNLAWEYTRDPVEITIEAENITVSEIQQELLHVSSDEKMKLLVGILKHENPESAIIFCNTKRSCEVIAKRLVINEIQAEFMIGDLPQSKRLAILKKFKAGEIKILVATDVAARGIDVDDLAMVINYDLPVEAENYVHRIGRTARAGKSGKAYTFCSEQDVYNLPAIERYIEMSILKCLFLQLLLILIRWKKISLPVCILRLKTGVVMMIMITAADTAKVKTAIFITDVVMTAMDVDTENVTDTVAMTSVMTAAMTDIRKTDIRKTATRKVEKVVISKSAERSLTSILLNSQVFHTKSA